MFSGASSKAGRCSAVLSLDGVHVEAGVSGAIPFHERPEGGRLWAELRKGDTVVASKLDRMFRCASDCLAVVEAFKARGVSLFLLDLNGGADDCQRQRHRPAVPDHRLGLRRVRARPDR